MPSGRDVCAPRAFACLPLSLSAKTADLAAESSLRSRLWAGSRSFDLPCDGKVNRGWTRAVFAWSDGEIGSDGKPCVDGGGADCGA